MSDDPSANGADSAQSRQRPSWYVPQVPLNDGRTVEQIMLDTFGEDAPPLPEELQDELVAHLDQFRVPRES